MIEELWLTSGYWGFTLDPPMDMEARLVAMVSIVGCYGTGIIIGFYGCQFLRFI